QTIRERTLQAGQSMNVAGYTLTYQSLGTRQLQNAQQTSATVDVARGGSHIATLHPGKSWFPVEQSATNDVSIYHDPRNLGDVYTIADGIAKNGTLDLNVLVKPLVNLLCPPASLFLFCALLPLR